MLASSSPAPSPNPNSNNSNNSSNPNNHNLTISPNPSVSTGSSNFDRLFAQLTKIFTDKPLNENKTSNNPNIKLQAKSNKLDEHATDYLYEFDRILSLEKDAINNKQIQSCVRLFMDKIIIKAENYFLREIVISSMVKALSINSNSLSTLNNEILSCLTTHRDSITMRLAYLSLLNELTKKFGNIFCNNLQEIITLLNKISKNYPDSATRQAILQFLTVLYGYTTNYPRQNDPIYLEIMKLFNKYATEVVKPISLSNSTVPIISNSFKKSLAGTIQTVITNANHNEIEILLPLIIKHLIDSDIEIRYDFANAMGIILYRTILNNQNKPPVDHRSAAKAVKLNYDFKSIDEVLHFIGGLYSKNVSSTLKASLAQVLKSFFAASQSIIEENHYSSLTIKLLSLINRKSFVGRNNDEIEKEGRQFSSCIEYVVIQGLLLHSSERALELAAKSIISFFSPNNNNTNNLELNEYQIICGLNCLQFIFARLDLSLEQSDIKDIALEVLLHLLGNHSNNIRMTTAQAFRALCRSAPSNIATWLSVKYKIVEIRIAEMFEGFPGKLVLEPATFYSLHGHICSLCSCVSVINANNNNNNLNNANNSFGVPSELLESIFDVAKKLIDLSKPVVDTNNKPYENCQSLVECGWMCIASLISLGSEWVSTRLNQLFALFRSTLGKKPNPNIKFTGEELSIRARSLVALRSFVHIMRSRMSTTATNPHSISPVLKAIVIFLRNNFNVLKTLSAEKQLDSSVQLAATNMKSILMDIFLALPPISYGSTFVALLHLVVSEFTTKSPVVCTELNRLLNPQDNPLLYPGLITTEMIKFGDLNDLSANNPTLSQNHNANNTNSTANPDATLVNGSVMNVNCSAESQCLGGSIIVDYSWNWCLRPDSYTHSKLITDDNNSNSNSSNSNNSTVDTADSSARYHVSLSSRNNTDNQFNKHSSECYESIQLRCVNSCIRLFSTIFMEQSNTHKEQLLKHFLAIINKAKSMQAIHSAVIINISAVILGVCRDINQRETSLKSNGALDLLVQTCLELLISPNPQVRRAAGESVGLLVRVEEDQFLSRLFEQLRNQLQSKDVNILCSAVFSLGCIHRYGGAMKTMRYLPFTVAALALQNNNNNQLQQPLRLWILHSLYLAIDTGGLAFSAYVQPTLTIITAHLNSDIDNRNLYISQCISRIITAVMSALGPDVSNPTPNNQVEKFLNCWSHLSHETAPIIQLETINTINQLVLWSTPMDYIYILNLLVSAIESEDLELKLSAVRCILRWAEKDPNIIARKSFERRLLLLLDRENDIELIQLIQHTLTTFVTLHSNKADYNESTNLPTSPTNSTSPFSPSGHMNPSNIPASNNNNPIQALQDRHIRYRLFDSLKRSIMCKQKLPSDAPSAANTERIEHDDDDEDGGFAHSKQNSQERGAKNSNNDNPFIQFAETRWQTKVFALELISKILISCKSNPQLQQEFDPIYARKHSKFPCHYVIQQLPDLIVISCYATSSSYDSLRIVGTQCTLTIVNSFNDIIDPDSGQSETLLQFYAAQVTTSLSQSLKNKSETIASSPDLRCIACELCVHYLISGITTDEMVINKFIKLLFSVLTAKKQDIYLLYSQYDQSQSTKVLLAHLSALAKLHYIINNPNSLLNNASSKTNKKIKSNPKYQALVIIKQLLQPQLDFLIQSYYNALHDYSIIILLTKKDLNKLKGFYFDGSNSTNLLQQYQANFEELLKTWSLFVSTNTNNSNINPAQIQIVYSIVIYTLNNVFLNEINSINSRNRASFNSTVSAHEIRSIPTCLDSLQYLLQTQYLNTNCISSSLLIELIPLLTWSLQSQNRNNLDAAVISQRQSATIRILTILLNNLTQSELLQDNSAMELFHCLLELFSQIINAFIPMHFTPTDSSPNNLFGFPFADNIQASSPSTQTVLHDLIPLFPGLVRILTVIQCEDDIASAYFTAIFQLLILILKRDSVKLADSLVQQVGIMNEIIQNANKFNIYPNFAVAESLLNHCYSVINTNQSPNIDQRVGNIVALNFLLISVSNSHTQSNSVIYIQKLSGLVLTLLSHSNPKYKKSVLQSLARVSSGSNSSSLNLLVSQLLTQLLSITKNPTSTNEERKACIQIIESVAQGLGGEKQNNLFTLVIPIFIHCLQYDNSILQSITSLATSNQTQFKQIVSQLNVDLKQLLQQAAIQQQQQVKTSTEETKFHDSNDNNDRATHSATSSSSSSSTSNIASKTGKKSGSNTGVKKNTKSNKIREAPTDSAPSIALSTDFSNFGKKK